MPNLTILGLEDSCHSDYQCFVFDGIKSKESPEVAKFITRWVVWSFPAHMTPTEGEDYHVNIRHINAITDASTHDVKDPHLTL